MDYAFLGEKDRAFEWLEKAFAERSSWLVEARVDPLWDPLRSDPRYNQLLQKMGYRIEQIQDWLPTIKREMRL